MAGRRPGAVTASCLLGCLVAGGILVMPLLSDPGVPKWVLLVGCGEAVVILVSMAGLWHMKKWGIVVFAVLMVGHHVLVFAAETGARGLLWLPILIVVISARHFSEMDWS